MAGKKALIVVDMQNDFCPPHGSLAVPGGRDLIPSVNRLLDSPFFDIKVATQDWHPSDHISFADNHDPPNNKPFDSFIDMPNIVGGLPEQTMKQRLWPIHCVQNTNGAQLVDGIHANKIDLIVKKGMDSRVEMYSAFADSFGNLSAGTGGVTEDLAKTLSARGVSEVYVVGLAGDYCVKSTALDAVKAGFAVTVLEDVQRCADPSVWATSVSSELQKGLVKLENSTDLAI